MVFMMQGAFDHALIPFAAEVVIWARIVALQANMLF